ncbi:MAG: hypothetical protein AAF311_06715 [Pseudomonadota bacterium]
MKTDICDALKTGYDKSALNETAYTIALENRRFEIEHYWRRTNYLWTLIAALFVAYFASKDLKLWQAETITASLGVVISFAWILTNKASKFWQENWEFHVDALENSYSGPVYKMVLMDRKSLKFFHKDMLTSAGAYSVSRVNQLVSLFVFLCWLILFAMSMLDGIGFPSDADFSFLKLTMACVTVAALVLMAFHGRTSFLKGEKRHSLLDASKGETVLGVLRPDKFYRESRND